MKVPITNRVPITLLFFFLASLCEIGAEAILCGYEFMKRKKFAPGLPGGTILFVHGIIPTLQPTDFGRVYAAYGGIFIISSIIWGRLVDKKKPDRYEIIGSLVAVTGAAIKFYAPR